MKTNEIIVFMVLVVAAFLCVAMSPVEASLGFGREGTVIEQSQQDQQQAINNEEVDDGDEIMQGAIIIAYRKDLSEAKLLSSIEECKLFVASCLKHRAEYIFLVADENLARELEESLKMWELEKVSYLKEIPDEVFEEVQPVLGDTIIAVKAKYYDPSIPRLNFFQKFMKEVQKYSGIIGMIPGVSWNGNWNILNRLF